jgi:hypothetical protein
VYGPHTSLAKKDFLQELKSISSFGYDSWLIYGDFNFIRKRTETTG